MNCPVCGSTLTTEIFNPGSMPLSVAALESDPLKSDVMARYPIRVFGCKLCGHVFNSGHVAKVSVYEDGCTMYNSGASWRTHMRLVAAEARSLGGPYLEIGGGTGEFAHMLGDTVVYEPSDDARHCLERGLKVVSRCFRPGDDLQRHMPNVIIMRHVLEHFVNPRTFLEELADAAHLIPGYDPILLLEVPNITNALKRTRIEDWVYEHIQHFTPQSLETLLKSTGWDDVNTKLMYNDEVILTSAVTGNDNTELITRAARDFEDVPRLLKLTKSTLEAYRRRGKRIAFWGGAGKSAMLLNLLDMGEAVVVDSDMRKVDMCVPGTRHKIRDPEILKEYHPNYLIVTTSWRAEDIVADMIRRNISCDAVLTFQDATLKVYQGSLDE